MKKVPDRSPILLVDAFGTLVKLSARSRLAELLRSFSLDLSPEQARIAVEGVPWPLFCDPSREALAAARTAWLTRPFETLDQLVGCYREVGIACAGAESRVPLAARLFAAASELTEWAEGAQRFLLNARRHCAEVVVVTNSSSLQVPVLRKLLGPAQKLAVSGTIGRAKPDPEFFEAALDLCAGRRHTHDAIMVGDDFTSDALGAAAAGIPSVLVTGIGGQTPSARELGLARELLSLARLRGGPLQFMQLANTPPVRVVETLRDAEVLQFVRVPYSSEAP